jgi:hypothetical protein
MKKPAWGQEIPTELNPQRFDEFILPHLTVGRRGPAPKLSLHAVFNYKLKLLYLGCQWKELPIEKDATGRREIHHSRIWRTFRRWVADGGFNAFFEGTAGRQISPPAAPVRTPQSAALRLQDPRLHNDQSPPLLQTSAFVALGL